jgi:small subunit ribosomal protein S4
MLKACKKCRRESEKLMLKGERCTSPKCAMIKRPYAPGQHGQSFHGKTSEYGKQLREKQKARRIYGMGENQFALYAEKAEKIEGNSAENLLILLESRLDNILYRLGFADSRSQARQFVSHGLFKVNEHKVSIPSFLVKTGDIITPAKKEKFKEIKSANLPTWIALDQKNISAKVNHAPTREEIDTTVNESLIIEFYSR